MHFRYEKFQVWGRHHLANSTTVWRRARSSIAGSSRSMAKKLEERGARAVYAAISHGVFAGDSMRRIEDSPIEKLIVTDSVETQPVELGPKIEVVSVAPLFAEAIKRIYNHESISVLFPQ